MIPNSFNDELTKIAIAGLLPSLGKFLGKNVPSMLSTVRNSGVNKAIFGAAGSSPIRAQLFGGAAGALGGGYAGSKTGTPETQGRNTLIGAVAGGAAGAFGFGKLAPKMQTFGTKLAPELQGLGKHMSRAGSSWGSTVDYAAKNMTPTFKAVKGRGAPTAKNFFGRGSEVKATAVQTKAPSMIGGAVGQLAKSIQTVKNAPNPVTGIGKVLSNDWKDAKYFTKDVGGKTFRFERSGVGKLVNPALTSGAGFGALEAATMTNEDGTSPTLGKRLLSGGTTAVAWGAAPKLMFGKMLAYDIPKSLTGNKQQQLPQQQI